MKKGILASLVASMMLLFTTAVFADAVLHIWSCKLNDDKTQADAIAVSSVWLKAARSMPGGVDLKVSLSFPLAAHAGGGDFNFVLVAADTKSWGVFFNDYDDSAAAEADAAWDEVATCNRSGLWQSVSVE